MDANRIIAGMEDGKRLETYLGEVAVEVRTIGELSIPTGFVVACDPGCLWSKPVPFKQAIPPGRYSVRISIAHRLNGEQLVALAALSVKPASPIRFEMATRGGEDVRTLTPGQVFGHGVDSGTSSFMDLATAKILYKRRSRSDHDLFMDYMASKMKRDSPELRMWADIDVNAKLFERPSSGGANGRRLRQWSAIDLDPKSDSNFIIFSSGFGDGLYSSYWGYTSDSEIACLTTDFGVLVERAAQHEGAG